MAQAFLARPFSLLLVRCTCFAMAKTAAKPRAKCQLGQEVCTALMKLHVKDPTIDDGWMSESPQQACERYDAFLQSIIPLTDRLVMPVLKKSFMALFEGTWDFADMWAAKIMHCFSSTHRTSKCMVDGKRLEGAVASLAGAWKRKPSLSPSPSPSPPPCRVKFEAKREQGSSEAESAALLWATEVPQKQEQLPSPTLNPSSSSGMSEVDKAMSLWGSEHVKAERLEEKPKTQQVSVHCMHAPS